MAYQIAFDLYEGATQQFLSSVTSALKATVPFVSSTGATGTDTSAEGKADKNGITEKSGWVIHIPTRNLNPFSPHKWLTCNFSLQYPYIIWKTGNESTQTYQLEAVILM